MINVTVTTKNLQAVSDRFTERAAVRAYDECVKVARDMEVAAVELIGKRFINERAGKRRKPGIHLINSLEGVVVGARGSMPVAAVLRPKRGADKAKVAALEKGALPHVITPSGNGLAFPREIDETTGLFDKRRKVIGKFNAARGKNIFFTKDPVFHPGNQAFHFMADARRIALVKLRARH